jgi:hypothetical protein
MDKKTLITAGRALYGDRWQTSLAHDLGLSDGRRIRQWLSDERPIPAGLRGDLLRLLSERKMMLDDVLFHITDTAITYD